MVPRGFDTDRIGPYRILRALESTGAASYVAREEGPAGFRRDVVLTVVAERDAGSAPAVRDLAGEATLGSRFNHPNIVRTHDFFAHDGRLVLVTEHVDGITLAGLLASLRARQERLSDAAALHIGVAVLEALAHAHAQVDGAGVTAPIAHQRVEPSRVFLGKDGSVKLGGFGMAHLARDRALPPADPSHLFAAATEPEGEKADVRAAGLLLWEMLTGREPAAGIESLSVARSDLPRELSAAVGAAIDVANAKRAIGCAEAASWIKKVARFGGGRDELRARVALLAPPAEPEPPPTDANGESSPRVPLSGWSVRLAPLASKVLSVGSGFPRLDAARARLVAARAAVAPHLGAARAKVAARWPKADAALRAHPRAALGVGLSMMLVVLLSMTAIVFARPSAKANAAPQSIAALAAQGRVVPAAPSPPTYSGPEFATATAANTERVRKSPPPASAAPLALQKNEAAPTLEDKIPHAVPAASSKAGPPPPKGFGYLTVHSSHSFAYVYVQLYRYGRVDRRLTVRCGKRFISLGAPRPGGGEPIWYAPSRYVEIPCGSSTEVTMMPKWIP